ncbi:hypothetical protein ZOSMA_76G01000 [Zostera marina]|uniref:Pentatricopeptide repeat-containing protein n=1 Tax=Zostera marina TaxID=29655 RepID=A0A0K9NRC5_ZOSMR|nr:hypothetical protein ZOSMA_76G01000 [Zostera marina]
MWRDDELMANLITITIAQRAAVAPHYCRHSSGGLIMPSLFFISSASIILLPFASPSPPLSTVLKIAGISFLFGTVRIRSFTATTRCLATSSSFRKPPPHVGTKRIHFVDRVVGGYTVELFKKLAVFTPPPPISTFNKLLTKISRSKLYHSVVSLYRNTMLVAGITPDPYTYGILIKCFCGLDKVDMGFAVFGIMIKKRMESDTVVCTSLIVGLCRQLRISDALNLFERMPEMGCIPNSFTYTAIIRGFCCVGHIETAIMWLRKMGKEPISTYCFPDAVTYTIVIDALCKDRRMDDVFKLVNEMDELDIKIDWCVYSCIIRGFVINGDWEKAVSIFEKMVASHRDGPVPKNSITLNTLMTALSEQGKIKEAHRMFNLFVKYGQNPDIVAYSILLKSYILSGQLDSSVKIWSLMIIKGISPDVYCYNILINGYCKNQQLDKALNLLKVMVMYSDCPNPDIVTYNSILYNICMTSGVEAVELYLQEMDNQGISPDVVTYNSLMLAFFRLEKWGEANRFFSMMKDHGVCPNIVTYTILIDTYCKQERMNDAYKLFDTMVESGIEPNLVLYNSLMNGHCDLGEVEKVFDIFKRILLDGHQPNAISYSILVKAYCRTWDIDRAFNVCNQMKPLEEEPNLFIYNTLLVGLLQIHKALDAQKLLDYMHIRGIVPNIVTYTIMLKGLCRIQPFPLAGEAMKLYDSIDIQDFRKEGIEIFNVLIHGMFRARKTKTARLLFQSIETEGLVPNIATCDIMIYGLVKFGLFEEVEKILVHMKTHCCHPDVRFLTTINRAFSR